MGSGSIGRSGSGSIISSTGWISSKSARPGASGIGPRTIGQMVSIEDAVMGFSIHPIAPAEYVASCANFACLFGARNKIRQSLLFSLISNAAKWPSIEGISSANTTNSGSILMYSSTALSPSSHTAMLNSFCLKIEVRR